MIQHRARPDTRAGGSKQQNFEVGPAGKIFLICLKKSLAPHQGEVYPILFLNVDLSSGSFLLLKHF